MEIECSSSMEIPQHHLCNRYAVCGDVVIIAFARYYHPDLTEIIIYSWVARYPASGYDTNPSVFSEICTTTSCSGSLSSDHWAIWTFLSIWNSNFLLDYSLHCYIGKATIPNGAGFLVIEILEVVPLWSVPGNINNLANSILNKLLIILVT